MRKFHGMLLTKVEGGYLTLGLNVAVGGNPPTCQAGR
jgi:hypothetical protein